MKKTLLLSLLALLTFTVAAQEEINIAGSSTVYPISLSMAEEFNIETDINVSVQSTGTGGGFELFCNGETVVNDASRPIKQEEIDACEANGITPVEIEVAFDALTVAVNPENDWVDCMTTDELTALWQPDSSVQMWSDINSNWPEEEINLFGPATTSGTFDYFTETIIGEEDASRTDYFPSEEDEVLAENVSGDPYAMVYLGYAYYAEDTDRLKALAIDGGDGCVEPSVETIEDNTYTPLSRPLFIYVADTALSERPEVLDFVNYYLDENNRELIADTGYALLNDARYQEMMQRVEDAASGMSESGGETGGS